MFNKQDVRENYTACEKGCSCDLCSFLCEGEYSLFLDIEIIKKWYEANSCRHQNDHEFLTLLDRCQKVIKEYPGIFKIPSKDYSMRISKETNDLVKQIRRSR